MGVQGNNQQSRGYGGPGTRVYRIPAHHPSKEEVEALAGAAVPGRGEEARACLRTAGKLPEALHKRRQRREDRVVVRTDPRDKQAFEAPVRFYRQFDSYEQRRNLASRCEPVLEAAKPLEQLLRLGIFNGPPKR